MKKIIRLFGLFCLISLLLSCLQKKAQIARGTLSDGRYDTEFPSRNASTEIEAITHSVKKLYSVSAYKTYYFRKEAGITGYHIRNGSFAKLAFGTVTKQESVSGTATMIGCRDQHLALLTCAHIVVAKDTIISWFQTTADDQRLFLKSISIKLKQENYIKDYGVCGTFAVLAADLENDVAIIGKNCEGLTTVPSLFGYPAGRAKELGWGCFVYIMGYPTSNLIVTKGLVSSPRSGPNGEFTVDALLNKGFSGGIILAIRDGVPNFEIVGMVKSITSQSDYYMKPEMDFGEKEYNEDLPYEGDLFVGTEETIQYGMNNVVPFETILSFYRKHQDELIHEGYFLDDFFLPRVKP